jgi:hypothetical protein
MNTKVEKIEFPMKNTMMNLDSKILYYKVTCGESESIGLGAEKLAPKLKIIHGKHPKIMVLHFLKSHSIFLFLNFSMDIPYLWHSEMGVLNFLMA